MRTRRDGSEFAARPRCVIYSDPFPSLKALMSVTPNAHGHLLAWAVVYGCASLAHFVHNAVYLESYPNMPEWLTPLGVMAAWFVLALIGAVGGWMLIRGSTRIGLAVLALYAALGFAGLDHYAVAPVSAHSMVMSATIVAEVIAAAVLLTLIVAAAFRGARNP